MPILTMLKQLGFLCLSIRANNCTFSGGLILLVVGRLIGLLPNSIPNVRDVHPDASTLVRESLIAS